jgi:lysylphosphatidylglycerol synthetase-like protein (DUF2156 family)
LKGSCFVLLLLTGLLFLFAARLGLRAHGSKWNRGTNGLFWSLMLPVLAGQPVLVLPCMAVLLFSLRSRETSGQLLSKRISLLRPHPVVLVIQEPLRFVLVMGASGFLFLLCQ